MQIFAICFKSVRLNERFVLFFLTSLYKDIFDAFIYCKITKIITEKNSEAPLNQNADKSAFIIHMIGVILAVIR